jgi:hypothetical protein
LLFPDLHQRQSFQRSPHKLVYTTSFQSLVNKTLEIWLPIKNKIYEIKFDASNESQYETFLPDFEKILNSIEINKSSIRR